MKMLPFKQGTREWRDARLGLPTASCFDKILTPTGQPSKSAGRYLARLAAEWFLGYSLDEAETKFMERGSEYEAEARRWYEFDTDATVDEAGLCLSDDGAWGASPDGLVGKDGLVELKIPSAEVQMMYILEGPPSDYFVQCQGQLLVTGREWVDLVLWNPSLPKVRHRYERDADFLGALAKALRTFTLRLDGAKLRLAAEKAARLAPEESHPF